MSDWKATSEYQDWTRRGNHWRFTLRRIDIERAREKVADRHWIKEAAGIRDPRINKRRTGEEAHWIGMLAEVAIEEFTGVESYTHRLLRGDDRIKDFTINGRTVQCKSTHHLGGRMLLTPSHRILRADYAVLVVGDGSEPLDTKRMHIVGVIERRRAQNPSVFKRSTDDRSGPRWQQRCDFIEQRFLTPIHEIFPPRIGISLDFDKTPYDARPDPWKQGALPLE